MDADQLAYLSDDLHRVEAELKTMFRLVQEEIPEISRWGAYLAVLETLGRIRRRVDGAGAAQLRVCRFCGSEYTTVASRRQHERARCGER